MEDDEYDDEPRRDSVLVKTVKEGTEGEEPLQLVLNANGDRALIQVFVGSEDDSSYAAAVQRAERAAAAAAQGALRSSLRHPILDLEQLRAQKRVVKLSLQASASELPDDGKLLLLRLAPT